MAFVENEHRFLDVLKSRPASRAKIGTASNHRTGAGWAPAALR